MLKKKNDLRRRPQRISSAVFYDAVAGNDLKMVSKLLKRTPFPADEYGYTPLHVAASYGWTEMIKLLLDNGADVNAVVVFMQETPLQFAVIADKLDAVKLLVEHGADIYQKNGDGNSAIDMAYSSLIFNYFRELKHVGAGL
jgi:ankyrin repeat protein